MKTRKEIEEYLEGLGIEIRPVRVKMSTNNYVKKPNQEEKYTQRVIFSNVPDDMNYYIMSILNKEAENALLDLISKSITNDDMETAVTAIQVLQEESYFYKQCKNAAIRSDITFRKRMAFDSYCQEHNIEDEYAGIMPTNRPSTPNKNNAEKDEEER